MSRTKLAARGRDGSLPRLLGGWHCLDFINTVERPISDTPEEFVHSYGDLVRWSWHAGAVDDADAAALEARAAAEPHVADRVLGEALALRAAIGRIFRAVAAAAAPPTPDVRLLRDEYVVALAAATLAPADGGYLWTWRDGVYLHLPVWLVVTSAIDLLVVGDLTRVKQCPGAADCGWLFYDTSRTGTRRWCSMEGCGSRVKMRRHYARRRPHEASA